ncbi:class I SAM-dependent DNA methyltransferase [Polyangium mundeleinium]|uniref:Methyltransferase domain-containing protein n=1 Tax=Polyangium mundeleinium TaxID=2995306 RepID=A0ABT5EY52_9BACT|nr:class I SAM-dependent methyltransferase [Polyangium mundeleinium]MDC0746088.1 methyltransferase domain-containing protein [Polyangium mundeleinium]
MSKDEITEQAAAFDAIGEKYDEVFADKRAQVEATRWLAERLAPGDRVLDVGCGSGIPTAKLLVEAGLSVHGIDVSKEMLRLARRNAPGATFEQVDMVTFSPEPGSFGGVAAFFSLLMLRKSEIPAALGKITRALRPGGYLVVSMVEGDFDFFELPFLGHAIHVSAYPQEELEGVLREAGFEILDMEVVNFPAEEQVERQLYYRCRVGGGA